MSTRPTAHPDAAGPLDAFRKDVVVGLGQKPRTLPCKYFYDAAGSRLFEQIGASADYYLTRADLAIMQMHAREMANALGPRCLLIEYGSGSSIKTRLLLDHLSSPAGYIPIDISHEHLLESSRRLAREYPHIPITPQWADFTQPFFLAESDGKPLRRAVYFSGSTIGNFTPVESVSLLSRTAELVGSGGQMLLGVDLKKDPAIITAAYNDRDQLSAAFNLNLLERINRELGADFALDRFWHHAFYHPVEGRIEMHLVSRIAQDVRIDKESFAFAEGESICTEYSYKYSMAELKQIAAQSGFSLRSSWLDPKGYFAVVLLTAK
jgi:dimethylhistidine N-methyltransferase